MHPSLLPLLTLQDCDQRVRSLQMERAQCPAEKEKLHRQLLAVEEVLEQKKARLRAVEVERKSLEGEVAAKRAQIARYKTQQMQTRKNEEYAALSHEIQTVEKCIAALEDQELALMEEAEALLPTLAQAEEEARQKRAQVAEQFQALESKAANLQKRIEELESNRTKLREAVEPSLLELYQRLFQAKGGHALVVLQEGICGGCHMRVPTQTMVEVRQGKALIHCPQCGRWLYEQL